MSRVLEIRGLSKNYGKIRAVRDLDLVVDSGQVFGILGPNGSGKTTTLGMLLGVTKKNAGEFDWFGMGEGHTARRRIGAILEHPVFYPYMSAVDNLSVVAHIKQVKTSRVEELLRLVGLYDRRNDPFKTYSLGMKQRLAIAASLVSDPEVLIFDEPTNGLDPQGIADIRRLIIDIAGMGKTILLASHLLDEVQKVCTHFAVLRTGSKIYQGEVEEVLNQKQRIDVNSDDKTALKEAITSHPDVAAIEEVNGVFRLNVNNGLDTRTLNKYLFERGIIVSVLTPVRTNLEEQFLAILAEDDS